MPMKTIIVSEVNVMTLLFPTILKGKQCRYTSWFGGGGCNVNFSKFTSEQTNTQGNNGQSPL